MTIACESGLFVGIDQYRHLQPETWPRNAQDDAHLLYSYFTQTQNKGHWTLLQEGSKRLVRLTLIEEITQWIEQVSGGKAGILYFSGHTHVDSSGLILAATDFKPTLPFDSGLPLQRLFQLLRGAAPLNKYFVFILDCCRNGEEAPLSVDHVPENVCVLLSCPHVVRMAAHANLGGTMTHAMETELWKHSRDGETWLSLYDLYLQIKLLDLGSVSKAEPVLAQHRGIADRILLPLAPAPEEIVSGESGAPEIRLDGFQLPPRLLDMSIRSVREAYIAWFGLALNNQANQREWVRRWVLDRETDDGRQLQVILPHTHPLKPAILLSLLLDRFPNHFHHLVIIWNRPLDPALFQPIARKFPGSDQWTPSPENASLLTFRKNSAGNGFLCRIWVAHSSARTELRLWGEVRGFEPLPLDKLLPELTTWLDILQSISPTVPGASNSAVASLSKPANVNPGSERVVDSFAATSSPIKVFISYSHQDMKFLEKDSLLGYLGGLEREGFSFWHDRRISAGELWDEEIQRELRSADIALVLVSQALLNSKYCTEVEVVRFVKARQEAGLVIFPVILSACDWKSYDWLSSTQFEPRDGRTIRKSFRDKGKRDELYLRVLEQLREIGQRIRERRKL